MDTTQFPTLFDAGLAPVPVATRHDDTVTLEDRFEAFHAANPWVMDALVTLARDMRAQGHRTIGIGMLFEVLRWQHARSTSDPHSGFKLNNSYRALYARRIMDTHTDLADVFNLRERTAA